MSEEQTQTVEEVLNVFYPDAESEPLEAPTEESAKDEEPEEAEESVDDEAEAEEEADEGQESEDDVDDEGDTLVYEIDGEEYTAEQIKEFKAGSLRQADYTKKTQALADERKAFEEKVPLLEEAINKTKELSEQLEVLVAEDSEINWTELKEDDPDEYIRLKERADNRKAKLKEVKDEVSAQPQSNVDYEAQKAKLVEANPQWLEDGKPTEAYKADMNLLTKYYGDNKWTQEQMQRVAEDAAIAQLVIEDARRKAESKTIESKKAKAKKKIIATPKSGKVATAKDQRTAEEIFYGSN